jgi:hypothetical protein
MDRQLRMHLTKKLVNSAVRVLNRLIPEEKATFPQTVMTDNVFKRLFEAYKIEAYCGRFDEIPYKQLPSLKDKNFMRFLTLSRKLLLYLGENDRYYRAWLGYAFILAAEEKQKFMENLTYKNCFQLIERQWELDVKGVVPPEHFHAHKDLFCDMVLADFLVNLA